MEIVFDDQQAALAAPASRRIEMRSHHVAPPAPRQARPIRAAGQSEHGNLLNKAGATRLAEIIIHRSVQLGHPVEAWAEPVKFTNRYGKNEELSAPPQRPSEEPDLPQDGVDDLFQGPGP
jgi:hypothetical protein